MYGNPDFGKTALAVHWAHRAIDRFPDGQLYVDLRGFDPSARAMTSAEALRGFLDGLEVPPKRIPSAPEEQKELYRRLVAGKRMLVLLDNARDEEQIGPLLPRSPGCLAIVTSRNRLTGSYDLDLLSREESRELLVRRVGDDDVDAGSVERVVDACSRLPLALAVVAARAVCSGTGLAAVAAELAETGDTLDLLAGNDALTDIRAAFSWSYHALGDDAARLFRLLGLHPGPDITVAAAVSLAGAPQVFEELSQAHLVIEHKPGRYAIHDLLRVYAKELVQDDRDAVHRMLDHYVHSARDASQLITGPRQPFAIAPPRPGVVPEVVGDYRQAMDWFGAEHAVLRGLFDVAASMGFDEHVGALAWALAPYLDRRAYWSEWVAVQQAAVAAAERRGDAVAEARAERMLGHAYVRLRRYGQAEKHCRASLDLFRAVGDEDGEAWAHHMAGYLHAEQGRWQESMDHHGQALVLLRRLGHRSGEATQLTEIGRAHSKLGDHREAVVCCRQALDVFTGDEDETGSANAWVTLGQAYLELGQRRRAIACHERAVAIYRDTGNRYREGLALLDLGDALKDPERAREKWQRALAIFEDLEHPYADRARTRLGRTAIMG